MLTIFSLLLRRKAQAPRVEPVMAEPAPEEERPRGCGWFDSSHDLQHGLQVHEREPDAVAAELPLAHWLDLKLSGWRATAPT
jgi:hypothetical protein